jgi:hypothetical protein
VNLFGDMISVKHFYADNSVIDDIQDGKAICVEKYVSVIGSPCSVRLWHVIECGAGAAITPTAVDNLQSRDLVCEHCFIVVP